MKRCKSASCARWLLAFAWVWGCSCDISVPPPATDPGVLEDECPEDPCKVDPGVCGCGLADADTDGDAVPDCLERCPQDPSKVDPGVCGCGLAEADTDGDTVPDCLDGCPRDPGKEEPGVCGCGLADVDTDGDTVPDCLDGCPQDSSKAKSGVCGCGRPETSEDQDADGVVDCVDLCPSADDNQDADGDGTPDFCERQAIIDALTGHTYWHLYSPCRGAAGEFVEENQIRRELQMLYDVGARGLVTYGMMEGVEHAPRIAKEIGYEWVLAGIYWGTNGVDGDPPASTLQQEKDNLEANIQHIDGVVIGNEGLVSRPGNPPRYTFEALQYELLAMRLAHPDKPVSTAEGHDVYIAHPVLVSEAGLTDFVFPNLHPWWGGFRDPVLGADNVQETIETPPFSDRGDRVLVLHESWWPSETEGQTEQSQVLFFQSMLDLGIPFCWGETIDQRWKTGPEGNVGSHWGLWHGSDECGSCERKAVVNLVEDRSE